MGVGEPALWGNSPYGGNRPQRGIRKGYYGEPAPNAGYSQGYCGGNRPQRGIRKGCRWLLSRL